MVRREYAREDRFLARRLAAWAGAGLGDVPEALEATYRHAVFVASRA